MSVVLPISRERLDRELCRRRGGFYRFVKMAWPIVESSTFVDNWHIEEVCAHLEAVSRRELDRLVVNIPPGFSKSIIASVMWNAWDWIETPARKYMFASFDGSLTQRDALRAKDLVRSEWFQARWGATANQRELAGEGRTPLVIVEDEKKQNTATIFWTGQGGLRFSTSVGGRSTGWHGHHQVVDDPIKPRDLDGGGRKAKAALARCEQWWNTTMSTRKADPKNFARVIIMQRLHDMDIAGLAERSGDYCVLKLPMSFNPRKACVTPWGGDRRTEAGELLCPERFDAATVKQTAKELGPMAASAQLEQNPTPEGGSIFNRKWFIHTFKGVPVNAFYWQSWDTTFDDTENADYVVGAIWAAHKGKLYRCDEFRARVDFLGTIEAIKRFIAKWPKAKRVVIEKKANGAAIINTLKQEFSQIVAWDPGQQSKEGRAVAVTGYFEAGDVLLPESAPWVADYVEELVAFPKGQNDDRVDETSQAILYQQGRPKSRIGEAMENV